MRHHHSLPKTGKKKPTKKLMGKLNEKKQQEMEE